SLKTGRMTSIVFISLGTAGGGERPAYGFVEALAQTDPRAPLQLAARATDVGDDGEYFLAPGFFHVLQRLFRARRGTHRVHELANARRFAGTGIVDAPGRCAERRHQERDEVADVEIIAL